MLAASTGRPSAADTALGGRLLRFTSAAIGDHRCADQLLGHSLTETATHLAAHGPADAEHEAFTWMMTVRYSRRLLDAAEASHWWAGARAAEHAWADPHVVVDPDSVASAAGHSGRLAEVLAGVPDVDRIAVLLHDVEAMPFAEVAAVTRSPVDIATQRVRRGRMNLVVALAGVGKDYASDTDARFRDDRCSETRLRASGLERGCEPTAEVAAHLARCASCGGLITAMSNVLARLDEWPVPAAGSDVIAQLSDLHTAGHQAR